MSPFEAIRKPFFVDGPVDARSSGMTASVTVVDEHQVSSSNFPMGKIDGFVEVSVRVEDHSGPADGNVIYTALDGTEYSAPFSLQRGQETYVAAPTAFPNRNMLNGLRGVHVHHKP